MDVADESLKVPVLLDEAGLVSTLEQMAHPGVPAVEELSVGGLEAGHDPRQRRRRGAEGEVKVVRHQAVGEQAEPEPVAVTGQPLQEVLAVPIAAEDVAALVSASGHVVDGPGKLQTRRTRHIKAALSLNRREPVAGTAEVSKSRLTPSHSRPGSCLLRLCDD